VVNNPYFQEVATPPPPPPPTGPTGFHVVALKCGTNCADALEIAPSGRDDCLSIAENQTQWWGAAFPPGPAETENNADQIPPFSLLDHDEFTVFYVFDDTFSSQLCGLDKLNITFTKTDSGYSKNSIFLIALRSLANSGVSDWINTDNHSGTCTNNNGASPSTCDFQRLSDNQQETYTVQEQLSCVDSSNPSYCAM
jgi:hypothetical protein